MARYKNIFDDEFRAKKVFIKFERKQKLYEKSPYNFTKKYGSSTRPVRSRINSQVVVKITSSSTNFNALTSHIRYISRNGSLEVITSENEIYKGRENIKKIAQTFNDAAYTIPTENDIFTNSLKEKRETLNMVFSMKDYANASTNQIRTAAIETIKQKYPNNHFVIAMHNDTDNPHCHLSLRIVDCFGKRIQPKKKDLDDLRKNFALELNKLGVSATTKIYHKFDKNTGEEINKNIFIKGTFAQKPKHKAHHYQVVNFGEAHFKFNLTNRKSFFVRYRSSKGKDVEIWGNDLKRVVKENNVLPGDYCRFVIEDEKPVKITIFDKKTKQMVEKTAYKKEWNVSIEGKNEKELKPLKRHKKNEYKFLKDKTITQEQEQTVNGHQNIKQVEKTKSKEAEI